MRLYLFEIVLNSWLPYSVASKITVDWEGLPGSSESLFGWTMEQRFPSVILIDYRKRKSDR